MMTSNAPPTLSPAARRLLILIENRPGFLGLNMPPDDDASFVYGREDDDEDTRELTPDELRLFQATGATIADFEQLVALKSWEVEQAALRVDAAIIEATTAQAVTSPRPWSKYGDSCKGCGRITIKHFRRGYCGRCYDQADRRGEFGNSERGKTFQEIDREIEIADAYEDHRWVTQQGEGMNADQRDLYLAVQDVATSRHPIVAAAVRSLSDYIDDLGGWAPESWLDKACRVVLDEKLLPEHRMILGPLDDEIGEIADQLRGVGFDDARILRFLVHIHDRYVTEARAYVRSRRD